MLSVLRIVADAKTVHIALALADVHTYIHINTIDHNIIIIMHSYILVTLRTRVVYSGCYLLMLHYCI